MPVTEDDILGRRIELLFVSSALPLTANTAIYTVGNSPFITPSNKEFISFVSVTPSVGAGNGQISFGSSSGGTDWCPLVSVSGFSEGPNKMMFYPQNSPVARPGTYGSGTVFWCSPSGFNASSTATFRIYGFPY